MTKQEVFDKVLAHLRAQGRKALDDRRQCMYRAPDGAKCAAGCLISDEQYGPRLEGKSANMSKVHAALSASGVPEDAMPVVQELQGIHDSHSPDQWEAEFARLAKEYGLTYAPPH